MGSAPVNSAFEAVGCASDDQTMAHAGGEQRMFQTLLPIPLTGLFPQRSHQCSCLLLCPTREKKKVPKVHVARLLWLKRIGISSAGCFAPPVALII